MLLNFSQNELETYRAKISPYESVGDGMAYLVGKEIKIEREVVYAIIERLLASLALSLNVGKNLEPYQLSGLAKKIYAKYYYFSFDEVMYVFDKGTSGVYGKIYDRIDEEIIFSWLEKFDTDERLTFAKKSTVAEIESNAEQKQAEQDFLAKHLAVFADNLNQEIEFEKQKEENFVSFREKYFNKA